VDNVIDILKERGFIDALTGDEVRGMVEKPQRVYVGFDPTADSLHLGNLIAIIGLAWFQRCGHTPVVILGGATGLIGDPSGKSTERQLLDKETIVNNIKGIRKNLEAVLDFDNQDIEPMVLNNLDWFAEYGFIDFLRDTGKYFRMGVMLSRDSVRTRLSSDDGMSFTEFSYQLLQAYDFLYLSDKYNVTIQMGGSDQWGNIVGGKDLVRKVRGKSVEGVTFPLLTRSDGTKFGKSENGTIWLSEKNLSVYEFYQYLIRVADGDVIKLMRLLTFMDMDDIRKYEAIMKDTDYIPNTAQKRLAEEVTRIVHGEDGLKTALRVTAGVSPGAKTALNAEIMENIAKDLGSVELATKDVLGVKFVDVSVMAGLVSSKGEARRLVRNKGAYLNNNNVIDENSVVQKDDLIDGRLLLLGAGKKKKIIVKVTRV